MSARPQIRINSVIVKVLTIYISPESEFISEKTHDLKPYRPKKLKSEQEPSRLGFGSIKTLQTRVTLVGFNPA